MPLPGNLLFQDPSTAGGMAGMDPLSFLSMLVAQGIRPSGMLSEPTIAPGGMPSAPGASATGGSTGTPLGARNPVTSALGALQAVAPPPVQTIMPAAAPRPEQSSGIRGGNLAQLMAMMMGGA